MDNKTKDTIIEINNLEFAYEDASDGEDAILRNVSLCVKKGEFLAVLGHNGSGKSTLAKHLNAILVPQNGKVFVDGMDTSDENLLYDIRQKVGMVFQSFNLFG